MNISISLLNLPINLWSSYLNDLKKLHLTKIHFDVMDGHFVPVISFGHHFLKTLHQKQFEINVHLMVKMKEWDHDKIKNFLSFYCPYVKTFIFHFEAIKETQIVFLAQYLKEKKLSFGLAIKTTTQLKKLYKYLKLIDHLIVMTVSIGFSGQKFDTSQLKKITTLIKYRAQNNLSFLLEVDGGINSENFSLLNQLGCDSVVMGSFMHQNLFLNYQKIKK